MDVSTVGPGVDIVDAVALKKANDGEGVSVSLLKKTLDMQKTIGFEIAKMLEVGTTVDTKA